MTAARKIVDIGPARLILGNAYEERPALGWVDADIMDPPYVIATSGGGRFRKTRKYLDDIAAAGIDKGFDHAIINPMLTGSVCVFSHNDQIPALSSYLQGVFHRFVIGFWAKTNPIPVANKHLMPDVEPFLRAWNQGFHPIGEITQKRRAIVVDIDNQEPEVSNHAVRASSGPSKTFGHPTVKPLEVMRNIIRTTGGTTICDAFMGTGSTGVAALLEGRRFIGIEKDEHHFQTACQRIEEVARKLAA